MKGAGGKGQTRPSGETGSCVQRRGDAEEDEARAHFSDSASRRLRARCCSFCFGDLFCETKPIWGRIELCHDWNGGLDPLFRYSYVFAGKCKRGSRAKQSQMREGWEVWGKGRLVDGGLAQEPSVRNKANLRGANWGAEVAGWQPSLVPCETKPIGRCQPRADGPACETKPICQRTGSKSQAAGKRKPHERLCETKPIHGKLDGANSLAGKGVMLDSSTVRNKANPCGRDCLPALLSGPRWLRASSGPGPRA